MTAIVDRPAPVDWYAWHEDYDEIESPLTRRLDVVQDLLATAIDDLVEGGAPGVPLQAVSIAAGQGRELLPVLITHPAGSRVRAVLVERDARNAEFAEGAIATTSLQGVVVRVADAGDVTAYADALPADLVLVCGLLEEVVGADEVAGVIAGLSRLCAQGARLVWTADPVRGEEVASLLAAAGFVDVRTIGDEAFVAGAARWPHAAGVVTEGARLF